MKTFYWWILIIILIAFVFREITRPAPCADQTRELTDSLVVLNEKITEHEKNDQINKFRDDSLYRVMQVKDSLYAVLKKKHRENSNHILNLPIDTSLSIFISWTDNSGY